MQIRKTVTDQDGPLSRSGEHGGFIMHWLPRQLCAGTERRLQPVGYTRAPVRAIGQK